MADIRWEPEISIDDYQRPPPRNSEEVIEYLPREGGSLELDFSGNRKANVEAVSRMVAEWSENDKEREERDGRETIILYSHGDEVARIDPFYDDSGEIKSASVFISPAQTPELVKKHARTVLENLVRCGLRFPADVPRRVGDI